MIRHETYQKLITRVGLPILLMLGLPLLAEAHQDDGSDLTTSTSILNTIPTSQVEYISSLLTEGQDNLANDRFYSNVSPNTSIVDRSLKEADPTTENIVKTYCHKTKKPLRLWQATEIRNCQNIKSKVLGNCRPVMNIGINTTVYLYGIRYFGLSQPFRELRFYPGNAPYYVPFTKSVGAFRKVSGPACRR